MRLFLCAFSLFALCGLIASPLDAAPKGRVTLAVPPATAVALRGLQSPTPVAQTPLAAGLRGSSPFSPSPLAQDAGECRHACAKPYYICLSDQDAAPDCPQAWTSCLAACGSPGSTQTASPGA